ncbi:MAG: uracil phosphoribosyltransferase [Bacteroidota bacterium]
MRLQPLLPKKTVRKLNESLVICSILRAGIPLHQGLLHVFDRSENAFVSAYRRHSENDESFEIVTNYAAAPNLNEKTLILADPMLAAGQSIMSTLQALSAFGTPKHIHIVSIIGSKRGVDFISNYLPKNVHLWIGDIDPVLNDKSYIVPGHGDAGDLSFGEKLNE